MRLQGQTIRENNNCNQQPNNRDRNQAFVSKSESKLNVMIPAYVVTLMEMGYSEDVINTAIVLCKQHGKWIIPVIIVTQMNNIC